MTDSYQIQYLSLLNISLLFATENLEGTTSVFILIHIRNFYVVSRRVIYLDALFLTLNAPMTVFCAFRSKEKSEIHIYVVFILEHDAIPSKRMNVLIDT